MTTMVKQQDDERRRRQKVKNWVLFAVLFTFVAVVYFVALIRMGGG